MSERHHEAERLGAYLDGELDASTRERVEAHLHACEACRDELQQLQELQQQLRRSQVPDPGPSYWQSFGARVEQRLPAPVPVAARRREASWLRRGLHWFRPTESFAWSRLAGAAAMLVLVSYVGIRSFPPRVDEAGRPAVSKQEANQAPSQKLDEAVSLAPPAVEEADEERPARPRRQPSMTQEQEPAIASDDVDRKPAPAGRAFEAAPQDEAVRPPALKRSEEVAKPKGIGSPRLMGVSGSGAVADSPTPSSMEVEVHHPETEAVEQTRLFVVAALAGDVATARFLREDLRQLAPADTLLLRHADTWLQTSQEAGRLTGARMSVERPTPEGLLALEALVWPHRDEAAWRGALEEVARRLAQEAPRSESIRQRALAHAQYLERQATDEASRAHWREELERLQP